MATLVLTAAGALLGPVGGAVGALIGQAIDSRIFAPAGRQGPRLQDLKVQTSSYGAAIPKLFGTLRVAGTVIWATDLIESRTREGGGKGRPSTTRYSYSASFAVLLSGRAIRSVGRIWADGNLLRGAAGDWKRETGFRLHLGGEDQAADPFIASAEGADGTPAYRGGAYAVFENMALGSFGNRIPSLTFEVEADAGPVATGAMLAALSGGRVANTGGTALRGFAASGETVRGMVEALSQVLPLRLRDDGAQLAIIDEAAPSVQLTAVEIGEEGSERLVGQVQLPGVLSLSYYEPERDHQAGVQAARRPGGRSTLRIELPAALAADEARALAEDALAHIAREQGRRTVQCGWTRITAAPGTLVRLPDDAGLWRVAERNVGREGVRLELRRMRSGSAVARPTDAGRNVPAPDLLHGPTVVHVLDLPNLEASAPAVPRLLIAAAGPSPGWRRAALLTSLDGGASWSSAGATAAPAVIGSAETVLPYAPPALFDTINMVEVALLHAGMALEEAEDARLFAGANLALIGDELVQFGEAVPLGGGRWRLSRLLRGRRGSDWAGAAHAVGERFVLIESDTLLPFDPPLSATGGELRLLASGIGDAEPVAAGASGIGEALRPPAPVQLQARRRGDGGFDLSWVRSSRVGWSWLDGLDAPLGEAEELYEVGFAPATGAPRTQVSAVPTFHYQAADVAADLAGGGVAISVCQLGAGVRSRPATLMLSE